MRVYFDMDGVLADFDEGVERLAGGPKANQEVRDSAAAADMWDKIRAVDHFYAKLNPLESGVALLKEVHEKIGNDCRILTGIPQEKRRIENADTDKIEWAKRFLPEGLIVNTVYRKEKINFCNGSEDILVDDFTDNIRKWEAAGGTGVLFRTADQAREELKKLGVL